MGESCSKLCRSCRPAPSSATLLRLGQPVRYSVRCCNIWRPCSPTPSSATRLSQEQPLRSSVNCCKLQALQLHSSFCDVGSRLVVALVALLLVLAREDLAKHDGAVAIHEGDAREALA
eukprot:6035052-Heterocapsa_arctica.AAC.1